MLTHDEVRDALDGMLLPEFERVLSDCGFPSHYVRTGLARAQQVNDLLQWADQVPMRWARIEALVERARAAGRGTSAAPEARADHVRPLGSPPGDATAAGSNALAVWVEKLQFLLGEEAIAVDEQKFRLRKLIDEARERIRELGGRS